MTPDRSGKPARVRWWRLRHNPLRRRSYLVEAWLLLAAWTLAAVAAVGAGVWTAHAVERSIEGLRAQRHSVRAVLTKDAERTVGTADGTDNDRAWATVRWTAADGTKHTGITRVDTGSKAGSTTRVWLDAEGRLVPAPATADQVRVQGAVLGGVAAVGTGSAVLLVGWGVCGRLERRRLDQWDAEWARVGPQWGHKTG